MLLNVRKITYRRVLAQGSICPANFSAVLVYREQRSSRVYLKDQKEYHFGIVGIWVKDIEKRSF